LKDAPRRSNGSDPTFFLGLEEIPETSAKKAAKGRAGVSSSRIPAGVPFVRVGLPFPVLELADAGDRRGLRVYLTVLGLAAMLKKPAVSTTKIMKATGLTRFQVREAVVALERAGLVTVGRMSGRSARVRPVPLEQALVAAATAVGVRRSDDEVVEAV
jgi:hypothetical protein